MSNRKGFFIRIYEYVLIGAALISCILAVFSGEAPFILQTKPFVCWCALIFVGTLFESILTYKQILKVADNIKDLGKNRELVKKILKSFMLRLIILICFAGIMTYVHITWRTIVLLFIFIPIMVNESIKENIESI